MAFLLKSFLCICPWPLSGFSHSVMWQCVIYWLEALWNSSAYNSIDILFNLALTTWALFFLLSKEASSVLAIATLSLSLDFTEPYILNSSAFSVTILSIESSTIISGKRCNGNLKVSSPLIPKYRPWQFCCIVSSSWSKKSFMFNKEIFSFQYPTWSKLKLNKVYADLDKPMVQINYIMETCTT